MFWDHKIFNWLTRFLKKKSTQTAVMDEVQNELHPDPIIGKTDDSVEETEVNIQKSDNQNEYARYKEAFIHTRNRYRERYGYYLTFYVYMEWMNLIKSGSSKATYVKMIDSESLLYFIEGAAITNVFVVVKDGVIVTVLPYKPELAIEAKRNRPIMTKKGKGKASKQVGRGILK